MSDVKTRILLRSDIASKWNQFDPTLLRGEIGICYDPSADAEGRKIRFKIGDGVHKWSELEFIADYANAISSLESKVGDTSVASQIETAINGLADVYQAKLPEGETGKYLTVDEDGALVWKAIDIPEVTWANITGDISDNKDLSDALDAKQDAITDENKLDASLIEAGDDNQFVTAAEKAEIAKISGLETAVGDENSGLIKDVADLETAVGGKADQSTVENLQTQVNSKVDAEEGKSLVSDDEIEKLESLSGNEQENVIETIKVNDQALEVTDKTVNIDLSGYVTDTEHNALAGRVTDLETASADYATKDDISGIEDQLDDKADAADVYTKDEVFTKEETQAEIAKIKEFKIVPVDELPEASADTMDKLYLVPKAEGKAAEKNVKEEYISIDNGEEADPRYAWEKIGETEVSLEDYAKTADVNAELAKKQDTLKAGTNVEITEDNTINVTVDEAEINEKTFVFTDDLSTMYTLGKYNGTKASPAVIPAKDKTFEQVWKDIFQVEENPSTTQPSVTIKLTNAGSYEVGTKITPAYETTFSAGSYTYGPATGVTASDYKIKFNDETETGTSGTFSELTVTDGFSKTISGTFDHSEGAIPQTNIGNEYEAGKIAEANDKACAVNSSYKTISGYRNMFFGTMTTKPETLTSGDIRALATKVSKQNLSQKEISIPLGAMRVVFAVTSDKKVTSVLDVNGLGAEIFSSFSETTVDVEGAEGYEAATYKVYYLDYANPNDKANKYKVTVTA